MIIFVMMMMIVAQNLNDANRSMYENSEKVNVVFKILNHDDDDDDEDDDDDNHRHHHHLSKCWLLFPYYYFGNTTNLHDQGNNTHDD